MFKIFLSFKGFARTTKPRLFPGRFTLALLILIVLVSCGQPVVQQAPEVTPVLPTATALPEEVDISSPWKVVLKTEVNQPMRMAAFIDEKIGLTGGANMEGQAHLTTDGGQTWTRSDTSSGCLFGLDIVNPDTIWECNYSDMRPSSDGGKTWLDQIRGGGQPGCMVSAVDNKTAWHLTPLQLEGTVDGGATRQVVALPEGVKIDKIATISLRTANDGYLLDPAGNLYITADGGKSWAKLASLGLEKWGEMKLEPFNGLPYAAIRFTDAEHGIIVVALAGGIKTKVLAMRTSDAGQTWAEENIPAVYSRPYLSPDGNYLTLVSPMHIGVVTVYHYEGDL
jgi:photosystem II stability/assembly factor-like uncharacterized protein